MGLEKGELNDEFRKGDIKIGLGKGTKRLVRG